VASQALQTDVTGSSDTEVLPALKGPSFWVDVLGVDLIGESEEM